MSKKKLILIISLLICLKTVSAFTLLPLCTNCPTNDGFSCTSCSTCVPYASLSGSYCACNSGYYINNQVSTNIYCDRCHTSCTTCSGSLDTNCLTCADRFTYDSTIFKCLPPSNSTDQTLIQAYNYYGFSLLTNWGFVPNISTPYSTYCASKSILGGQGRLLGSNVIRRVYNTINLPYHFALRIKVGFYTFVSGSTTVSGQAQISVSDGLLNPIRTYSSSTTTINNCGGYNYVHYNIDDSFNHQANTVTINIGLTNPAEYFGIRQFYLIVKKCQNKNCSKCIGYLANQCTQCVDARRWANYTDINNRTCLCKENYYQQPYSGQCVDPCPSVPIMYYGNPLTRFCVTNCPSGYFALDDNFRCELTCPVTSTKTQKKLFYDLVNRKCVNTCPSTQPYAYQLDQKCYLTCPATTYSCQAIDRRCVSVCPNTTQYRLYAHNGACIKNCPNGTFADPSTMKCLANCSSPLFPFKDNSTGANLCVATCPAPNFFGQTTNYYCVQTCPDGTYGQRWNLAMTTIIQLCLAQCNSPRWGLPNLNRKCVDYCPEGYWGEPVNRVCTNNSSVCNPLYANNYTRTCVAAASCSLGFYGDNSTWRCVPYCPNNSYAHPTSKICQQLCQSPYFRDNGVNRCVTTCITNNTYADVDSTRTCVTACNSTGGATPWADDSTKTCVNDCNNTILVYVADNTTWKCVYFCPANYYQDLTSTAPKCVSTCPSPLFADNSTGTGICVTKCSLYPRKFGDTTGGMNRCVDVCSATLFGDQTGNRLCVNPCPSPYYAQDDSQRLCVPRCKANTYGTGRICITNPQLCPANQFADDYTNLCVTTCPLSQGTFGDPVSKRCVRTCPLNPLYDPTNPTLTPQYYYADTSGNRLCVLTCNASHLGGQFGNNNTRTCQSKCLDVNAFAQTQTVFRLCVARCLPSPVYHYANNFTKRCVTNINCQLNYFGQNSTQICVQNCPSGSFGYKTNIVKYCIDICPIDLVNNLNWYGDDSSTKRICVTACPDLPMRYADPVSKLCVQSCPAGQYIGDAASKTCTTLCPYGYFAYQPTRICVSKCPNTYFGDDTPTVRYCYNASSYCGTRYGDPHVNLCVSSCTGPTPVNTFGYGDDCVTICPGNTYANYITRTCVTDCPDLSADPLYLKDLYGDPATHECVLTCIAPLTYADFQTRLCQPTCSDLPIPTYSQNIYKKCVISLNCPTLPSMTFGDNSTRKCLSNCTNDQFGDPNSRNCVTNCPDSLITLTQNYYGDRSTGINLCITICPSIPRLFGQNDTGLCVQQCPIPLYGDQTGKRSCLAQCPIVSTVYYYAQNTSRICVKVCQDGTWGLQSSRQCVQDPFHCGTQWADDSTHLCVNTCPITMNTFADPTTGKCVLRCPLNYYSDTKTRKCVPTCPADYSIRGTFANNSTRICQEHCTQNNAFADPQTIHRHCVLLCSQDPTQAFADPSTKTCVDRCPVHPDLYGSLTTFKCVSKCISPYYANTHSRRCELSCPASHYKVNVSQLCVSECPSNPDLYGDSNSGFCESTCTSNYHRYSTLRLCVPSCTTYSLFSYNFTCVKLCPYSYYADTNGICIKPCTGSTYGQNTTTKCEATCITGYSEGTLCVATCSDGLWGQNKICKNSCTSPLRASNQTNLCVSQCQLDTYLINGFCQSSCATGYADPTTRVCQSSCTNGRYGDPTTNKCVQTCPVNYYRDSTGVCLNDCGTVGRANDNITWNCQSTCSNGKWRHNNRCINICPPLFYGLSTDRYCYALNNRPDLTLFADNQTQTWVTVCSLSPLRFADRITGQCVQNCTNNQFADPNSRQCQTSCTSTRYFADSLTFKCVLICSSGLYSNTDNNLCQVNCTGGKYNYQPSHVCVDECPAPYYGYDDLQGQLSCVLTCLTGTYSQGRLCVTGCDFPLYADPITNICVEQCINSYGNIGTQTCQTSCVAYSRFADNSTNTCVDQCPSQPDLYMQNDVCVAECSLNSFADPTVGTRRCMPGCPQGLWTEPQSRRCLARCKPGYFGRNNTNQCSKTCLDGQFADNSTGFCQLTCPSPTYADTLTDKCQLVCTGNQFGQGRVCVPQCSDPLYGNPLNRKCQNNCPEFDYLFAQDTTRQCVNNCSFVTGFYADKHVRKCVDNCTVPFQYALDNGAICVTLCPSGLFMDNSTQTCRSQCDLGFAQPTSRYCVLRCFGAPQTFGHIDVSTGVKTCKYKCLSAIQTLFADSRTNLCVQICTDPLYADPLTGNCVAFCPEGYFAEDTDRTCTLDCNSTQFADNYTRKCVNICPTDTHQTFGFDRKCIRICPDGYYADNLTQECVLPIDCQAGSFADIITKYCVIRCPSDPLTFGHIPTQQCIPQCPLSQDLYGQFVDQTCVISCDPINGIKLYQDPSTRTCVYRCPIDEQLWADTIDDRCKQVCSGSQIRDNSTQMCVDTCPSDPQTYADLDSLFCVRTCPDDTFASDDVTRICTDDCQLFGSKFADNTTNRCQTQCPFPLFADNSTYLCVLNCPANIDYYADSHSRTCVLNCPKTVDWVTYADTISRSCVTKCPQGYYAVNSTQRCVDKCPFNQFADEDLNLCVQNCTVRPNFYKQFDTNKCVQQCPILPIKSYKYPVDNECVYVDLVGGVSGCPGQYYANPLNNMCTTLCPPGYYAQESSKMCVTECQITFVADPTDRKCKLGCTTDYQYYAYDQGKICVQNCPAPYFNNNETFRCTQQCPTLPILMYRYYQTRKCVQKCYYPYYGFDDNQTCLLQCPPNLFTQQIARKCSTVCQSPFFADTSTSKCVLVCPSTPDFYGHLGVCQDYCPDGFYKDNITRRCVSSCPIQPLMFADNSTNTCVKYCPSNMNFFADNITRKCVLNCSTGLFADVQTRTCVSFCPSNLDTYADITTKACQPTCPNGYYASDLTKQCVDLCPDQPVKTYAHINKCLYQCPQGYYGQNTTRTCRIDCSNIPAIFADDTTNLCVNVCPLGLYADNDTDTCTEVCPTGSYTDPTTRICVLNCPGTQRLFNDPSTQKCVSICPIGSYGDTINWVCLQSCPITTSGYRLDVGRLCVQQCPSPYFAFIPSRLCVTNCGSGLFGDPVSRTCQPCPAACPTCISLSQCLTCVNTKYLSFGYCLDSCVLNNKIATYANDITRTCVIASRCPIGFYGNNATKKCVNVCDSQMYKNDTTKRCQHCHQNCISCKNSTYCMTCSNKSVFSSIANFCYQQCNDTHKLFNDLQCVTTCPSGTYLDYTAVLCKKCNQNCVSCSGNALNCTECFQSFKYQDKCVRQCPTNFYVLNGTCTKCQSAIQSCNAPLKFNVQQTVQNFKPVVVIKFNQQTQVTGDPKNFIKIKLLMKRLLLQQKQLSSTQNQLKLSLKLSLAHQELIEQQSVSLESSLKSSFEQLQQFEQQQQFKQQQQQYKQRRLQSNANLINDGLEFNAVILPDGTIKLLIDYGLNLQNAEFQVIFTDTSGIKTSSGQSLQQLQAQIQLQTSKLYPQSALIKPSYIVGALILSILIIIAIFILLLLSPVAILGSLQAFQIISLFSYVNQLPPNLFWFLKQLRISRFTFLPNMFSTLYEIPGYFTKDIPVNVQQTQGQLSFSMTAGGFAIFGLFYLILTALVILLSSKYNPNRSLRNLFNQIYTSRVVYGLVHDFLWIFSLNVFVSCIMQFKSTDNSSDLALGVITMLGFLVGIGYIMYRLVQYNRLQAVNQQQLQSTQLKQQHRQQLKLLKNKLSFYIQGIKQSPYRRHTNTIYYIRKLIFSLILCIFIQQQTIQTILFIILFTLMMLYFSIFKPYVDNVRNYLHAANQLGLMFLASGIVYYIKINEQRQPVGHKLACGNIISYVLIVHLSIALIWAYFRLYFFIKELYLAFKQTEFYKLYMDEQYDNQLEKEIRQLKDSQNGQIQSIQITNFNDETNQTNDQNQMIKLKIKRKKLKSSPNKSGQNNRYDKKDYVKIFEQQNNISIKNKLIQISNKKLIEQSNKLLQQPNKLITNTQSIMKSAQQINMNTVSQKNSIMDKQHQYTLQKLKVNQKSNQNNIKKTIQSSSIHRQQWVIMDIQKDKQLQSIKLNQKNYLYNQQGYSQNQSEEMFDEKLLKHNQKIIVNQNNQSIINKKNKQEKVNKKQQWRTEEQIKKLKIQQDIKNILQQQQQIHIVNKKYIKAKQIENYIDNNNNKLEQNNMSNYNDKQQQYNQKIYKLQQQSVLSSQIYYKQQQNIINHNEEEQEKYSQKYSQKFQDQINSNNINANQNQSNNSNNINENNNNNSKSNNNNKQQSYQQVAPIQLQSQLSQNDQQHVIEDENKEIIQNPIKINKINDQQNDNDYELIDSDFNNSQNQQQKQFYPIKNKAEWLKEQQQINVKKKINNWADMQNILLDQQQNTQKIKHKKRMQMMIFDEEDFNSQSND